ncbi:hypothetical protein V1511DRAFT_499913 [Dipodascopsis uninucleata]
MLLSFLFKLHTSGLSSSASKFALRGVSLNSWMINRLALSRTRSWLQLQNQGFASFHRKQALLPTSTRGTVLSASAAGLLLGCLLPLASDKSTIIKCDYARGGREIYEPFSKSLQTDHHIEVKKSWIDYRELAVGSFLGLFVGLLIGKFSRLLVFFVGSTYLFLQFLTTRGIIKLPYNRLYGWARTKLGDKELILENPSFKLAFGSSMIVAAANI